ncbi:MAG: peptide ABC transporter ATP-binding protein [Syntrophus sp. (in: bacteria)]|nr:peptide ABC transporter ATP-binding protein [Syntrophus sp. (in: bacteria)]
MLNNRLLEVHDLTTAFPIDSDTVRVVDGVNFSLDKGEILGLVGESGSGKTMTSLSIMGLVPPPGRILGGQVIFEGKNLVGLPDKDMNNIRGDRIGMVFQEPMSALNPVFRVGDQICETIETHRDFTKSEIKGQAIELLRSVGFDEPEQKFIQYPHQLSGGQRQRILIAMAVSCNPSLVIADEPTTALDVATESQILCLLQELVTGNSMSMIFITHNLHIIKSLGNRIGIMYAGRLLEQNRVDDFFRDPMHPYSKGLLDSVVNLKSDQQRLKAIPGTVPKMSELPTGCKFHPRCPSVMPMCREVEPQIKELDKGKWVRCYLYQS